MYLSLLIKKEEERTQMNERDKWELRCKCKASWSVQLRDG